MSAGVVPGTVVAAAITLIASPHLARLTCSVADRDDHRWWRGRPASARRVVATVCVALVLGALAGAAARWSVVLPAFVALALAGTVLTVIDFESHTLPNRIVFPLAGGGLVLFGLAALVRGDAAAYLRALAAGAAVFAVLFLLVLASPRSFGLGDVKLGGVLGGYLGWFGWTQVFYGLFAGFLLGALVALVLLGTRRATMRTPIPFGPMLIVGALAVLAFDVTA